MGRWMINIDYEKYNTLPKLFWRQVPQFADKTTIWHKQEGVWKSLNWEDYGNYSKEIGNALTASGIQKGDKISILSETRPEWVMCDMGIICSGCVTAPIYHSNTEEQVFYIADQSDSVLAFVEDQEQLDKMLAIWNRLPNIKKIVVFDRYFPTNLPNVSSIDDFLQLGREYGEKYPHQFEESITNSQPDDLISFTYTSGTTGAPKAGMYTSRNIIASARYLPDAISVTRDDFYVCFLPLAHIAERLVGHFIRFISGHPAAFAESIEDMPQNIRQTGPTIVFGTPRVWEKFYARILTGIGDATWIQKKLFHWAINVGKENCEIKESGKTPGFGMKVRLRIAKFFIHDKIKDIFGGKIRTILTGAAPISREIIHFFNWVGLDVYEAYGMTETSGVITIQSEGKTKIGSVGIPIPGTELKILEDGEICCRGDQNIQGYYKNQEATNELLKPDGEGGFWLHTGDVGHIDEEGYLFITDRKKDIIITAGGKNVAPQNIENLMKTSPYISQAMVHGDKKPYLTMLVTLDEDEIIKFARDQKILYQDLGDLTKKEEVIKLINHVVKEKNTELASYESIKKIRILEEELDQDKDEITPTLKVKRKVVTAHNQDLLDGMY
jgi:long-chain acyl-CoA synthetase